MSRSPKRRAGFTLLEMIVVTAIFTVLVAALGSSVFTLVRTRDSVDVSTQLQDMGASALQEIRDDLRKSGFVTANGVDYPYLFDDGGAIAPFGLHAHPAAAKEAEANDFDFGPNREIVFAQPADDDGDGVPDLDGNGQLVWDANDFSFVLVTGQDGINALERRTNGGGVRSVARHVERVTFDTAFTAVGEVPLNAVRIRVWFRKPDNAGLTYRYFVQSMVRLRNG